MAEDKDNSIERLRAIPIPKALKILGLHAKLDNSYKPKDPRGERWYVSLESGEVLELLVIGEKWFDARAMHGGGGAIDLVMYLYEEPFSQAVQRLRGDCIPQDRQLPSSSQTKVSKAAKDAGEKPKGKSSHLAPERKEQGKFFIANFTDWIPKDDATSMEHPLFALKAGDRRVRVYERNGSTVSIKPGYEGRATIHDKDLWLYCISQLVAAKNQDREIGRTVRFTMYDFLRATNRDTGGDGYRRAIQMLERLKGTVIQTNIVTPNYRERGGFGLIDSWRVVERDKDERMIAVEVDLPRWLFCAIDAMQVLTISRSYFRLRKPIDRRIYELARKHCGQQETWQVSMFVLHEKSGSSAALRDFRIDIRKLADSNELPDYFVAYDKDTDMVAFSVRNRKN